MACHSLASERVSLGLGASSFVPGRAAARPATLRQFPARGVNRGLLGPCSSSAANAGGESHAPRERRAQFASITHRVKKPQPKEEG